MLTGQRKDEKGKEVFKWEEKRGGEKGKVRC